MSTPKVVSGVLLSTPQRAKTPVVVSDNDPRVGDASSTNKGTVQLAGDLGGTAAAPTVAKLGGKPVVITSPAAGDVLKYSTASGGRWINAQP